MDEKSTGRERRTLVGGWTAVVFCVTFSSSIFGLIQDVPPTIQGAVSGDGLGAGMWRYIWLVAMYLCGLIGIFFLPPLNRCDELYTSWITKRLGEPAGYRTRYFCIAFIGVLAMSAAGMAGSRSEATNVFSWGLLAGLMAFLSVSMLAFVIRAYPSHEDLARAKQETQDRLNSIRSIQGQLVISKKESEGLRNRLRLHEENLKSSLTQLLQEAQGYERSWLVDVSTNVESTEAFYDSWATRVRATLSGFDADWGRRFGKINQNLDLPLDIESVAVRANDDPEQCKRLYRKLRSGIEQIKGHVASLPRNH